jgi:hypothetical protein
MELFRLIKSLTRTEKRYIKRQLAISSERYQALFDALNEQHHYDEAGLKAAFQQRGWFTNFSEAKRNLSELILRALRSYNENRNPHFELLNMLKEIEILYYKAQQRMALRKLAQAKALAEAAQLPELMIHLLSWQRRLEAFQPLEAASAGGQADALAQQEQLFQRLQRKLAFRLKEQRTTFLMRREGYPCQDPYVLEEVHAHWQTLQERYPPETLAFEERYGLAYIRVLYELMRGQPEQAYQQIQQTSELIYALPHATQAEKLHSIINLMQTQLSLGSELHYFEQILEQLERFRGWLQAAHLQRARVPLAPYIGFAFVNQAIRAHQYLGHAEALRTQLRQGEKVLATMPYESEFYYFLQLRLAQGYCQLGEPKAAKPHVRQLLAREDVRPDIQNNLQLLRLMIEYDLGRYDLREHLVNKAQRHFRTSATDPAEDRRFVQLLQQLYRAAAEPAADSAAPVLDQMAGELLGLFRTPESRKTRTELLFMLGWVRGHQAGTAPVAVAGATLAEVRALPPVEGQQAAGRA